MRIGGVKVAYDGAVGHPDDIDAATRRARANGAWSEGARYETIARADATSPR